MTSTQRNPGLEETTWQSQRAAMHMRYCDFSMDQVETANSAHRSATCHLQVNFSASQIIEFEKWLTL
jgi:hypothetical protein